MEYIVFENGAYSKKLERQFFRYCAIRQLSLLKFVLLFIFTDIARYFHLISRKKYLETRWSFLPFVKNPHDKAKSFAAGRSKRVFLPTDDVWVLSEHPGFIVKKMCGRKVTANQYNNKKRAFHNFRLVTEMIGAYGDFRSPIMKKATVRNYVSGKKVYTGKRRYALHVSLNYAIDLIILIAGALIHSSVSLYYASANHEESAKLFASYFSIPRIFWLNTIPVVLLFLLLYFLFNRVSTALLLGGIATYSLSLTQYFKIQFRSDPIWFDDIYNINEAGKMTDRYTVELTNGMIIGFIVIFATAVVLRLLLNDRIRLKYIRPIGAVTVVIVFAALLNKYYLNENIYVGTKNPDFEKAFSTRDQYIARGFVFPLLYSITNSTDEPPVEYKAPVAKDVISKYSSEDIPEDKRVTLIGIMLEAYGDFRRFDSIEFTTDPYEQIDDFLENSYTGVLVDDIFAAGTVTTERQFLTGLSDLPSFRKYTNSYVWYLREQGYVVDGGHPSHSWFYERKNANVFLGFQNYNFDDDYYFDKYGYHIADNYCLFDDVYDNFFDHVENGEKAFSFYITYEGHGPYDDTIRYFENDFPKGFIKDKGYSKESLNIANNYFYIVYNTNKWLNRLASRLNESPEPVALVLFGDHMPWMGNNNSVYEELGINLDLSTEEGFFNYYETPYIIWANDAAREICGDGFRGDGGKIGPYFLMNRVFSLIGWKGDEYMQYMTAAEKPFTALHGSGYTICGGKLTKELSDAENELLKQIKFVQYYRKNKFIYDSGAS